LKPLYCISGLGADEKIFSKINLPGYELHFIQWIIPQKNEPIESYAKRMGEGIHHSNPVLIGLSFGGMIAIEIAKQIPVEKVILISSIKSAMELPQWMRLAGKFKLNRILPLRSNRFTEPFQNRNLGVETEEEKLLARYYRRNINREYVNWAVNAILNWKGDATGLDVYQIHGESDRIFSIKNLKANFVIPSAGHMMIMNRAEIITNEIKKILEKF